MPVRAQSDLLHGQDCLNSEPSDVYTIPHIIDLMNDSRLGCCFLEHDAETTSLCLSTAYSYGTIPRRARVDQNVTGSDLAHRAVTGLF